jgi:hypothetical protein
MECRAKKQIIATSKLNNKNSFMFGKEDVDKEF